MHIYYIIYFYRCDAEPSALAKYVLALIRKPYRSDDDLKEGCSTQLDVFLQGRMCFSMVPFVKVLFRYQTVYRQNGFRFKR